MNAARMKAASGSQRNIQHADPASSIGKDFRLFRSWWHVGAQAKAAVISGAIGVIAEVNEKAV